MKLKYFATIVSLVLVLAILAGSATISYGDEEISAEFLPEILFLNKSNGQTTFISGKLTEKTDQLPEKIVEKVYAKRLDERWDEPAKNSLNYRIDEQFINSMGRTVVKTTQIHNGVPIYGTQRNFHINPHGEMEVISGKCIENISEVTPSISPLRFSERDVLAAIEKDLGYSPEYFNGPQMELILYPVNEIYKYVYKAKVTIIEPIIDGYIYYLDAENLSIIKVDKFGANAQNSVYGTGIGQFGLVENLKMAKDENTYYLINLDDNFQTGEAVNYSVFRNFENHFESDDEISRLPHGVDAHYNLTKVIEFFKGHFNRNSYDNNGGLIRCRIMFGPHNARAEPYGNWGNHSEVWFFNRKPLDEEGNEIENGKSTAAALDIVAHEFFHLILFHEGLDYNIEHENMVLHEGLADTFGVISEYALEEYLLSEGSFDWYIGEDTGRSMRHSAYPNISKYSDISTMDPYIPHHAGGVITKAAYLMAEGGSHNNQEIEGIGYSKMARIFYKAASDGYIVSQSSLKDFATYAITAANLLVEEEYSHPSINGEDYVTYDKCDVNAVIKAFTSVELLTGAPENFEMISVDDKQVQFTWDGDPGINYGLYRKTTGSQHHPELIGQTTGNTISAQITPGVSFDFYIAIIDENGNRISNFSNVITVLWYYDGPENFKIQKRIGPFVEFKWKWNTTSKATFALYRESICSQDEPVKIAETTSKKICTLSPLGSYNYYVAVIDKDGNRISHYSQKLTVSNLFFIIY